ncbi:hypothetical protein EKH80_13900 [Dyella choica]|uniref:Uncharacterized protein n=1 Tax=Dyella choica TaxID=1927959 RepID=A0A3S0Q4B0_9GAMM|nr:hypothetical protein EKH80_13900 [Dyella choica]
MGETLLAAVVSLRAVDYLELVDWSGRMVRDDKRGSVAPEVPAALAQLGLRERQWQSQMLGIEIDTGGRWGRWSP